MRSAVRIGEGNYRAYTSGESGQRNRKSSPKGYAYYFGEVGHGKTPMLHTRRTECPAYGKKCQKCGHQNHIDKACLRGRPTKPPFEEPDELYDEQTAAFADLSQSP